MSTGMGALVDEWVRVMEAGARRVPSVQDAGSGECSRDLLARLS